MREDVGISVTRHTAVCGNPTKPPWGVSFQCVAPRACNLKFTSSGEDSAPSIEDQVHAQKLCLGVSKLSSHDDDMCQLILPNYPLHVVNKNLEIRRDRASEVLHQLIVFLCCLPSAAGASANVPCVGDAPLILQRLCRARRQDAITIHTGHKLCCLPPQKCLTSTGFSSSTIVLD